jgi:hypothetical protein
VAALVLLGLLLIRPLLVLLGVLILVLVTLAVMGLLAVGFVLFAARLALGGTSSYGYGRRIWVFGRPRHWHRVARRGWSGPWWYN